MPPCLAVTASEQKHKQTQLLKLAERERMSVCDTCGDLCYLSVGHKCTKYTSVTGEGEAVVCTGTHVLEPCHQTDAHLGAVRVRNAVKSAANQVEEALVSGSSKCNKCGDEANSDAGLICGRSMEEETGLLVYCDGVYEGGDSFVVAPSPLRTRVMLRAAENHCDEECEVDADARVTKVADGYWVTAHLWVHAGDVE